MKKYLSFFFIILFTGSIGILAAQKTDLTPGTRYHDAVVSATFQKIRKYHYHPRLMDSVYSQLVLETFLKLVDPDKNIFLAGDIDRFAVFTDQIGTALNQGKSWMFDTIYNCYNKRLTEVSALSRRLLKNKFDFSINDSIRLSGNQLSYPKNRAARELLWRKKLKYAILKRYFDLDTLIGNTSLPVVLKDTAMEQQSYKYIRERYRDYFRNSLAGPAREHRFADFMSAAVGEIDPHTTYIAPTDRLMKEAITKQYYGIGIELGLKDASFFVKRMMRGGAAFQSGKVKENDQILAILNAEGKMQQVTGMMITQVANLIRGEAGSSVTLELEQPGQRSRMVTIARKEVLDKENRAKSAIILKGDKKLGYIYLPMFYTDPRGQNLLGASNDIAREVVKLKENEVDGIIMDLRDDGGGSLDEVVKMCSIFLPGGTVTWLRSHEGVKEYGFPPSGNLFYGGPLTVLVNENTASASEIFAAAMQDYHRAIIIGSSSTFGKGSAQSTRNMGKLGDASKGIADTSYGSLRLTEQKFYRVTGISTQLAGVRPDIVLQEKMYENSLREKNYVSALRPDTIHVAPFKRLKWTFDYARVVSDAQKRLAEDRVFAIMGREMKQVQSLGGVAVPLQIAPFYKDYTRREQLSKKLQEQRMLPAKDRLDVIAARLRSVRPSLLNEDPHEKKEYEDWLEKLSKDVYLNETVNVLTDMIHYKIK
ncbi:carboxy terminal-processing peptidase [Arachidicoccus terrestris]|uniref:carboxy terminal-processing peptidase n=1 Tax=Arachidicoccus terrestris TaxID=2875539 RepID=UPI001CC382F7|nr:carboxy terminal-processing peptidase [Arachidicoccus terrestris]UAY55394.1 carboxy terminal-processing peptidase [Arachidicoccus terrestris]